MSTIAGINFSQNRYYSYNQMNKTQHIASNMEVRNMTSNLIADNDADENGVLDAEEFSGHEALFNDIDKNEDGNLEQWELNQHIASNMGIKNITSNLIMEKDADENGVLDAEEFGADEALFSNIDKNEDGSLEQWELHQHIASSINIKI